MFAFLSHKTAEAAAVILKCHPGERCSHLRLIKLLYIADRTCLAEAARPVTGDDYVAMDYGPVLSRTLNLIKDLDPESPTWSKHFRRVGGLHRVCDDNADLNDWEIVEKTHDFPEWKNNRPLPKSSRPIDLRDIASAVGRDWADVEAEANDDREHDKSMASFTR